MQLDVRDRLAQVLERLAQGLATLADHLHTPDDTAHELALSTLEDVADRLEPRVRIDKANARDRKKTLDFFRLGGPTPLDTRDRRLFLVARTPEEPGPGVRAVELPLLEDWPTATATTTDAGSPREDRHA